MYVILCYFIIGFIVASIVCYKEEYARFDAFEFLGYIFFYPIILILVLIALWINLLQKHNE